MGERIAAAFAAGLVSIAFPCVLPLVPGYLSAISSVEVERLGERGVARRIVSASVPFAIGFTVVFVVLGAGAAALGGWVDPETRVKIAGFVLVVLGLALAGLAAVAGADAGARRDRSCAGKRLDERCSEPRSPSAPRRASGSCSGRSSCSPQTPEPWCAAACCSPRTRWV